MQDNQKAPNMGQLMFADIMVQSSEPSLCCSIYEFYLYASCRLSKSAPAHVVWLDRVAGPIGIDRFPFDSWQGNSSCLDGPIMGIVHRFVDPCSDYKFIHRRTIASRFCTTFTELPRRLLTRLFDDDLLRRSMDSGGRPARAFRRGVAGTLCRCVARRVGHLQFIHCAGIFIIGYLVFGKRTSAFSHADLSTGASAVDQRTADDSPASRLIHHRRVPQHSVECAGGSAARFCVKQFWNRRIDLWRRDVDRWGHCSMCSSHLPIRVGREETSATVAGRAQSRNAFHIRHGHIHHHIVIDIAYWRLGGGGASRQRIVKRSSGKHRTSRGAERSVPARDRTKSRGAVVV